MEVFSLLLRTYIHNSELMTDRTRKALSGISLVVGKAPAFREVLDKRKEQDKKTSSVFASVEEKA